MRPTPGPRTALRLRTAAGWAALAGSLAAFTLPLRPGEWWVVLLSSLVIAGVGLRDDIRHVPASIRFVVQLMAAGCGVVARLGRELPGCCARALQRSVVDQPVEFHGRHRRHRRHSRDIHVSHGSRTGGVTPARHRSVRGVGLDRRDRSCRPGVPAFQLAPGDHLHGRRRAVRGWRSSFSVLHSSPSGKAGWLLRSG